MVTSSLESLQQLRHVLVRLGARQAGRFWSNGPQVFASNLLGGAAAGAAASIVAAVLLGIDAHRGQNSLLLHVLRIAQTVIRTIQAMIAQELR